MRHAETREDDARHDQNRRDDQAGQVPADQVPVDQVPTDQGPAQVPVDQVATPPVGVAYATPAPPPEAAPMAASMPAGQASPQDDDSGAVLFGAADIQRFRARWRELQADFVDDPNQAVQGADDLVGEVMRALTEIVAEHKRQLEGGWRDGAGETEELRVALRRYRAFFDQLLTTPSPTP